MRVIPRPARQSRKNQARIISREWMVAKWPQPISRRRVGEMDASPPRSPSWLGRRSGATAISAGSRISANSSASMMPVGAAMPSSTIGEMSALMNDSNPPAVVKLVSATARPECWSAKAIESSFDSPRFIA
jgi:hypothetical protein